MKRLALISAALLLSACIPDPFSMEPEVKIDPDKIPSKTANIVITDSPEPGSTTKLTLDDMFKIELDANPTTGIWWSDPEFDESVLKLVSMDYIADPAPPGLAGSGGTTVMMFEAIAAGKTGITSEYSRGGGQVYERLDISVEVTE